MPSKRPERPAGLDLMPVMNLVALLIPMLLVTAQAVGLAVIDSSVPAIVGDREPTDPGLQLSLAVTDQGLTVASAQPLPFEVPEGPTLPCAAQPCEVGDYDYDGLTRLLAQVKDVHPDEESLILVPEDQVPFEVLVRVMDASREQIGEDGTRSLFPAVVMAGGAE
ncbi:MAG: biopolymer transporter ExbD [Pseudomonadota bacterium]